MFLKGILTTSTAGFCSVRRLYLLVPFTVYSVHLSRQDDSDEEPSTADQTPEHNELMEYVSLSCEEGEETTSSEVSPHCFCLFKYNRGQTQQANATFQSVQDNEMEGSDSNDEEWKSDSSRYISHMSMCSIQQLLNILFKTVLHMKRL